MTVITTRGEALDYGMTATAFSALSLDPPLVLVCIMNSSTGTEVIPTNGVFAVNVLTAEQEPLSHHFASRHRPIGADAFADIPHREVATGAPVIDDVAAFVDCRLVSTMSGGDHKIFIGEVVALGAEPETEPLIFHGSRYRLLCSG